MPVRLCEVVEFVDVEIHRASREFVQVRLPEVRSSTFDQGDVSASLAAEFVAEPSHELQSPAPPPTTTIRGLRGKSIILSSRCHAPIVAGLS